MILAERNKKRAEVTEKIRKDCVRIRRLEENHLPFLHKLILVRSACAVTILSALAGETYTTGQVLNHLIKKIFSTSAYYAAGSVAALATLAAFNSIPPFKSRYFSQDSLLGDIIPVWYYSQKELRPLQTEQKKNFAESDDLDNAPGIDVISIE